MDIGNIDYKALKDYSPEDIAATIFSKDPQEVCSCQILGNGEYSLADIFDILSIILMEGFDMIIDLKNIDLTEFSKKTIMALNPWIRSLGFDIKVREYKYNDKTSYEKYYCRIRLNRGNFRPLFMIKNITKSYHLFLNGNIYKKNTKKDLKDFYAIFENGDKMYTISFDFANEVSRA